jgi:uncharacterized protein YjbJ (UPF0337 family)
VEAVRLPLTYYKILNDVFQVGDLTGATSWQQSGRQEHFAGEAEIQAAQAKDYIQGTLDHAQGKLDSIIGAVAGDRSREVHGDRGIASLVVVALTFLPIPR